MGGTMAGTFTQLDADGAVMFHEFIQVAQTGTSLAVRLKHFDDEMMGWEAPDEFESFPLVAIEDDAAYFDGLTYERRGEDQLVITVRVTGQDEVTEELVFLFKRIG